MSKSKEVGTFGRSEVLATLTVTHVTKHEDSRMLSSIDGKEHQGASYEVIDLNIPYDEEPEKIRVGNLRGALVIGMGGEGFKLHVQDPKLLGKFKVGMTLSLVVDDEGCPSE